MSVSGIPSGLRHNASRGWTNSLQLVVIMALFQCITLISVPNTSQVDASVYLVIHSFMEIFSAFVSFVVFVICANSLNHRIQSNFFILSITFLAVGLLDLSHMLSYWGMPDYFSSNLPDKHLTFWLAARFMAAFGLLYVSVRPWTSEIGRLRSLSFAGIAIAIVLLINTLAVFYNDQLPRWFIVGEGLTAAKKGAEYTVIAIHIITLYFLQNNNNISEYLKKENLLAAICIIIMSEIYFTVYTSATGIINLIGHVYKVVAYAFIYRSVVIENIRRPYIALQEAQNRLSLAVEASNTGLWSFDPRSAQFTLSSVLVSQLGYDPANVADDEAVWTAIVEPIAGEDLRKRLVYYAKSANEEPFETELRLRHLNGDYRWMLMRGKREAIDADEGLKLIGSLTDISARRREEMRFENAVEAAPIAMIMVDRAQNVVMANGRAKGLFGIDTRLDALKIEQLLPDCGDYLKESFAHLDAQTSTQPMTFPSLVANGKRATGERFPVELGLSSVRDDLTS